MTLAAEARTGGAAVGFLALLASIAALALLAGHFALASLGQDLSAYVVAARAISRGLDPYVNHADPGAQLWDGVAAYRHSRFLYPPLVAQAFRPLAVVPYAVARALHACASLIVLIGAVSWMARVAAGGRWRSVTVGALATCALWPPLWAHLERGQVDLIAMALCAPIIVGRTGWPAALAFAAAMALKPNVSVLVVGLWFSVGARPVLRILGGLAGLVAIDLLVSGPTLLGHYLGDVLPRISRYGEGGPEAWLLSAAQLEPLADALESGVVSIEGRTLAASALDFPLAASLPRLIAPDGPVFVAFAPPGLLLAGALAWVGWRLRGRAGQRALLLAAGLPLSVVVSPTGWMMGLVGFMPAVVLMGARASSAGTVAGVPVAFGVGLAVVALGAIVPGATVCGAFIAGGACLVQALRPPPGEVTRSSPGADGTDLDRGSPP